MAVVADLAGMNQPPKILVVIGSTGSGKSDLALAMARRWGAEILSVDSMQVYRGMDIGTAKASEIERREIRHHMIDCVGIDQAFSVAQFVAGAKEVIADSQRRGVPLIAVGGTPLYFKSLFFGLFDGPPADATVRERLSALGSADLHERLKIADPAAAERIHVGDRKRLIRALEVSELTGKPISSFQTQWDAASTPQIASVWIGLRWTTEALNRRLNARVKQMMAGGWLNEVKQLAAQTPVWSATASEATGYHELLEHLHGCLSLDDAVEQIKIATRQLARRQMKWFKRFPGVHWLEGDRPLEENVAAAMSFWNA